MLVEPIVAAALSLLMNFAVSVWHRNSNPWVVIRCPTDIPWDDAGFNVWIVVGPARDA